MVVDYLPFIRAVVHDTALSINEKITRIAGERTNYLAADGRAGDKTYRQFNTAIIRLRYKIRDGADPDVPDTYPPSPLVAKGDRAPSKNAPKSPTHPGYTGPKPKPAKPAPPSLVAKYSALLLKDKITRATYDGYITNLRVYYYNRNEPFPEYDFITQTQEAEIRESLKMIMNAEVVTGQIPPPRSLPTELPPQTVLPPKRPRGRPRKASPEAV